MKKAASLLLLFLLMHVHNGHAQSGDQVTLYTDDFQGRSHTLGVGKYDYFMLVRAGISVVRSLKIPAGMKVTLYEKDNFEGISIELTENTRQRYLEGKGFGSLMHNTSLIVTKLPAEAIDATKPVVTIYRDNFSGASKNLAAGRYEFFEFGEINNDEMSSVKIPKGMQVTLYEHKGFTGKSLTLTQDTHANFLIEKKFNDFTSSILVEQLPDEPAVVIPVVVTPVLETPQPDGQPIEEEVDPTFPEVIIYQDDFTGVSKQLVPGRYDVTTLGIANNTLSSVKVMAGLQVVLYEQSGFKGKSLMLTEDANAEYLTSNQFNNVTSSVVIELVPRVTIYQDEYSGATHSFEPGFYTMNDLMIGNDELSSVKVLPGVWVLLFEHADFTGQSLLLTQDASADFVHGREFDNVTSSMIVGKTGDPMPVVTLYERSDFANPIIKLSPGSYPLLKTGNNTLSSIEIPPGLRVTLFDGAAYEGRSITLNKSVDAEFLDKHEFEDVVSSLVIEKIHPRDLAVTIYDGSFTGVSQALTPGRYLAREITIGRTISSVRVPKGMRVTLYTDNYFKGTIDMIDRDTDYTGMKYLDNIYTSIIVEDMFQPIVTPVPTEHPPTEIVPVIEVEMVEESPRVAYDYSTPCQPMSDVDYQKAFKSVESKPFSEEKMTMARLVTKDKCLSNAQIKGIASQFGFEEQTLEFIQYAYALSSEKSTYYELENVFKFNSSKEAFMKFLQSK